MKYNVQIVAMYAGWINLATYDTLDEANKRVKALRKEKWEARVVMPNEKGIIMQSA